MTRSLIFPYPGIRLQPEGETVSLSRLCSAACIPMRLTQSHGPDIRIHSGSESFRTPGGANAPVSLCLSGPSLPPSGRRRWVSALERLAYQFHDWAAREVLAAERRFLLKEAPTLLSERYLSLSEARLLASVAETREALRGDLAEVLRMAQPNVSRTIHSLFNKGLMEDGPMRKWGKPVRLTLRGRRMVSDVMDEMMLREIP